jgi:DNA-binding NarL/FixJ family response regulator
VYALRPFPPHRSATGDLADRLPAIKAGATGYLLKDATRQVLQLIGRDTTNREAAVAAYERGLLTPGGG